DPIYEANSISFLFASDEFGSLHLNWYRSAPEIKKGQTWQLSVRLKRPRSYKNPGGFDYARHLFFKRTHAKGYIDTRGENKLLAAPSRSSGNIRLEIAKQIDQQLAQRPSAALIKGLAVGIRDTMSDEAWELLQKTGTSHLLAISGLHIGLVSGLIFFLIRHCWALLPRLPLWVPAPVVAAWAAMIAALGYAALAGFAIPTQRAVIMIVVCMLCKITRYQFKSSHVLMFAGTVVVLLDPFALLSASFWLSFLAVSLLIYLGQQQAPKYWRMLCIQFWMSLGLMPIVIFYFQQISWVSPLANLFAIPWASFFVVPFTLLGVVASFIDIRAATFFWVLAESALNYLQWFLTALAQWSWSAQYYAIAHLSVALAIILACLLLLLPRAVPGKYLGIVLLAALLFVHPSKPDRSEIWLSVLDVGQGLAVVVQTAEHVLVYDAAMRFDNFDLGEAVIYPFLQHQGIKKIDAMILSHDNLDHTGGAAFLLNHMPVHSVISGEAITDLDVKQRCHSNESWQWDGVVFEFLYPPRELVVSSNDSSCVLKISTGEYSVLLTGDIEKQGESWLIKHAMAAIKTDILIAPHHGSSTSSTLPFVQGTQPQHVIFSTGYLNRYHFPNKKVVARYTSRFAKTYNTAELGAVSFGLDPLKGIRQRHL
ncbi:MAG TPA: DNA internalization-related competence protein ComEC/Rec2, partial [Gammaproteobacteria bacterium]|nr:DNA internalization-related competence protein ComEC/Rec2 [Gammaproteobacteria bacterium]